MKNLEENRKICHCFKIQPSVAVLFDNALDEAVAIGSKGVINGELRDRDEGNHLTTIYYEKDSEGFFVAQKKFNPLSEDPSVRSWK
jgi:hypothetical protein